MNAALPRLRRITGEFGVAGDVKIRPADLYVSTGYRQPGIVLVGDAFATTCPVTGTGTDKVFTDVAQLCNVHIPAWLATEAWARPRSRRSTTIRSSRPATPGRWRKPSASARSRSTTGSTGGRSAGRASWRGSAKARLRRMRKADQRGIKPPRSLLVVILIVVVFIVVVGLTGGIVRRVALVVPELAVDAVGGEQLRRASRARSPCRLKSR